MQDSYSFQRNKSGLLHTKSSLAQSCIQKETKQCIYSTTFQNESQPPPLSKFPQVLVKYICTGFLKTFWIIGFNIQEIFAFTKFGETLVHKF